MTETEFFRIPALEILYAPKPDRHFIKESKTGDRITWLSSKMELDYGGRGDNGWKLNDRLGQKRYGIARRKFKFGWDDNLYNGRPGETLRDTLEGYRLNKETKLVVPVSFLTATN